MAGPAVAMIMQPLMLLPVLMAGGGYFAKFLTLDGAVAAFVVGSVVVTADGAAMAMLISFFVAGSLATKFKKQRKAQLLANASLPESQQEEDASDAHRGRTAQQVVATGGIPALLCLVCRVHACCGCVGYVYAQSTCTTRPATSDLPNGG